MRQLEELKLTSEKLHGAGIWEQVQERRTQDRTKVINYQNMNQEKNAVGEREREGVIQRIKKLMLVFRRDWASSTSCSWHMGDAPTNLC